MLDSKFGSNDQNLRTSNILFPVTGLWHDRYLGISKSTVQQCNSEQIRVQHFPQKPLHVSKKKRFPAQDLVLLTVKLMIILEFALEDGF